MWFFVRFKWIILYWKSSIESSRSGNTQQQKWRKKKRPVIRFRNTLHFLLCFDSNKTNKQINKRKMKEQKKNKKKNADEKRLRLFARWEANTRIKMKYILYICFLLFRNYGWIVLFDGYPKRIYFWHRHRSMVELAPMRPHWRSYVHSYIGFGVWNARARLIRALFVYCMSFNTH